MITKSEQFRLSRSDDGLLAGSATAMSASSPSAAAASPSSGALSPPYVEILEQPASHQMRFRYECESQVGGRSDVYRDEI